MSAPIDVPEMRLKVCQTIHALGFLIDYCQCAEAHSKVDKSGWPAQVADDLGNARDMSQDILRVAEEIDTMVAACHQRARQAAVIAAKKRGAR